MKKNNLKIVIKNDDSLYIEENPEYEFGVQRMVNSGNPNYDPSTGQFSSGVNWNRKAPNPKKAQQVQTKQDKNFQFALAKRQDLIRKLARSRTEPTAEDVISAAEGSAVRELTPIEVHHIILETHQQRLNDLVDIIDGLIKKQGFRALSQEGSVIIKANNKWLKGALSGMSMDDIYDAWRRLLARGCTPEEIAKGFFKRFSKDKQNQIKEMIGESNDSTAGIGSS